MPIILLDGVEKAGKSTLSRILQRDFNCEYRHFGLPEVPDEPFDLLFRRFIAQDMLSPRVVVWDRGWPSDHVYGSLLHRDTRLSLDPWLGEWLYGRALQSCGARVILLGPNEQRLRVLRSRDDQPVDVGDELRAFQAYGRRFSYDFILPLAHDADVQYSFANILHSLAARRGDWSDEHLLTPPAYCGPHEPTVLVVGESRNKASTFPGSWLPFTSNGTTRLARLLGDSAFLCGWTNADTCPDYILRFPRLVVACGEAASSWLDERRRLLRRAEFSELRIPHPSWLYRWGKAESRIPEVEGAFVTAVASALGKEGVPPAPVTV